MPGSDIIEERSGALPVGEARRSSCVREGMKGGHRGHDTKSPDPLVSSHPVGGWNGRGSVSPDTQNGIGTYRRKGKRAMKLKDQIAVVTRREPGDRICGGESLPEGGGGSGAVRQPERDGGAGGIPAEGGAAGGPGMGHLAPAWRTRSRSGRPLTGSGRSMGGSTSWSTTRGLREHALWGVHRGAL